MKFSATKRSNRKAPVKKVVLRHSKWSGFAFKIISLALFHKVETAVSMRAICSADAGRSRGVTTEKSQDVTAWYKRHTFGDLRVF